MTRHAAASRPSRSSPLERPRVLVVDDDERVLRAVRRALEGTYEAWTASTAVSALSVVDSVALVAVIADFDLGDRAGRNGFWVLQESRRCQPEARRILCSELDLAALSSQVHGVVEHFVAKPATAWMLRKALHDAGSR